MCTLFFFFNDPAPTEIYTYGHPLSLHDALPIFQGPLAPADSGGPIFLTLIDEEFGPADRGTAQTYVETLLSLLPFGLAMVDRDGRFLYMNRAFARAAGLAEGRMPRYPGDLVVGEDKGPLADMIRRHSKIGRGHV